MPDATVAIIAAVAVFVFGYIAFLLVDTWHDKEDD
jgi:hypothetical protein